MTFRKTKRGISTIETKLLLAEKNIYYDAGNIARGMLFPLLILRLASH